MQVEGRQWSKNMLDRIADPFEPIEEEDLDRLEESLKVYFKPKVDFKLPEQYRKFLLKNNGGFPEPEYFLINYKHPKGFKGDGVGMFFPVLDNDERGIDLEFSITARIDDLPKKPYSNWGNR